MKVIEIDLDKVDDDLVDLLQASRKLLTKEQAMRKLILRSIDPNPGLIPFDFEHRPDDPTYLSLLVPPPNADIDLAVAWEIAQLDAKACALLLERDGSATQILGVLRNTVQWIEFWSVRWPDDGERLRYQALLSQRREGLRELRLKASFKFQFRVLEELKAI